MNQALRHEESYETSAFVYWGRLLYERADDQMLLFRVAASQAKGIILHVPFMGVRICVCDFGLVLVRHQGLVVAKVSTLYFQISKYIYMMGSYVPNVHRG